MNPLIIALAGQKGGVGKSTVAIALAVDALRRGLSVLLVDADPQGTVRTWAEVATEAGEKTPTVVAMGATMHRPEQIPKVGKGFDLVVIDCPPRAGDVQRSALMVADVAILPCGPSAADAWALASSLEVLTEAQTVRPKLRGAVLLTRVQSNTTLGKGARAVLAESGVPVLAAELGYRVAYQEAIAAGKGVTTYAPHDAAAEETRRLFAELTEGRKKGHDGKEAHGKAPKASKGRKRARR
jgi:chromosome partitioning protein